MVCLPMCHRRRDSPEQCTAPDTNPSIDAILPFLLSTTSLESRVPLPSLEGEKSQIQISDVTATDLDMKSCVLESELTGHKLTLGY